MKKTFKKTLFENYFAQLNANKFENLSKMCSFQEKYNIP